MVSNSNGENFDNLDEYFCNFDKEKILLDPMLFYKV